MPIDLSNVDTVVLDSSVLIKWLSVSGEENVKEALLLLDKGMSGNLQILVPELAGYEIGNALLGKKLSLAEYSDALSVFYQFPFEWVALRTEVAILTGKIAYQASMTFYDASFVAVAKMNACPLITANAKHQGKYPDVQVIPLSLVK